MPYSSFTVTWSTNTNPGYTPYEVSYSTDNFVTSFSTPVPFAALTVGTTNLPNLIPVEQPITMRIRAENNDRPGVMTAFSSTASVVTLGVPIPTGLSGTALGVSSISWTWNTVVGASVCNLYESSNPATLRDSRRRR